MGDIIAALITGTITIIIFIYNNRRQKEKSKERSSAKILNDENEQENTERLAITGVDKIRSNIVPVGNVFIGREKEEKDIIEILSDAKNRIVSIVGPGGIGKTRLAKEVGVKVKGQYAGGVWFVDLSETSTETGIAYAIHEAFEEKFNSSQIEPQKAVLDLLSDRQNTLLILDNFEQIIDLADESVAYWAESLTNIDFLVTSRIPLRIRAEQQYRLDSLELVSVGTDDFSTISKSSSVRLFSARAKQNRIDYDLENNFEYVNKICNDLEGIPLAIELVAGKVNAFSTKEIFERLDNKLKIKNSLKDRNQKHKTLEATIDWSYQLLKDFEKDAFLQLSIFRNGFTIESAESVILLEEKDNTIEDIISSLVEQSLLRAYQSNQKTRYDMFVAVNEYAFNSLKEKKSEQYVEELIERYGDYYYEYVASLNKKIHSKNGYIALEKLGEELENVFNAQELLIEINHFERAADLILNFADTMDLRGPAPLRIPKLKLSYEAFEGQQNVFVGRLAFEMSKAYWSKGLWNEGEEYADKAVVILEKYGELYDIAKALRQQGMMRKERGYLKRSIPVLNKAMSLFEQINKPKEVAVCLTLIGAVNERLGEFNIALSNFKAAENIAIQNSDNVQQGLIHNRRGLAYWHHGEAKKALEEFKLAEKVSQQAGNKIWLAAHKTNKALVLSDLGLLDESIKISLEADSLHKDLGTLHWAAVNYAGRGRTLIIKSEYENSKLINDGLQLIHKAEKIARKIYYPENISWHAGDLGRGYFYLKEYDKAYRYTKEAISLERRMGAIKEHRHYSNLVILGAICDAINRFDELWECLIKAKDLADLLRIKANPMARVKGDVKLMNELTESWKTKFGEVGNKLLPPRSIAGLKLPNETSLSLIEQTDHMLERTGYEYPWNNLESELKSKGEDKILLFGYGSLLNKLSAQRTIKKGAVEGLKPMIAFGVKRILDYNMPEAVKKRSHYELPKDNPKAIGLFNSRYTGSLTNSINGAIIEVDLEDIEKLREREVGYDLRPIVCMPWNDNDEYKGNFLHAYALGCSGRLWKGQMLSDNTLLPHQGYYDLCRHGAATISVKFLEYFLDTSFLADGITTAREWERSNKKSVDKAMK